jgi:hypothetical protein
MFAKQKRKIYILAKHNDGNPTGDRVSRGLYDSLLILLFLGKER